MRLPFKVSTTTSNFMIGVTAAASAGPHLNRGYIDPGLAMPVMVLGVLAGGSLVVKLRPCHRKNTRPAYRVRACNRSLGRGNDLERNHRENLMIRLMHARNPRPSGIATLSATGTEPAHFPPQQTQVSSRTRPRPRGRGEGSAVAFPGEHEKLPPAMHRT